MTSTVVNYLGHRSPSPLRGEPLSDIEPTTIPELFLQAAEKFHHDKALSYKFEGQWRSLTSAELIGRIEMIALGLDELGLEKGDRAAILSANSPEWTIADAACQFCGIIDVPIYTTLAPQAVRYILSDSGARLLFLENAELFTALKDHIFVETSLEWVVIMNGPAPDEARSITLEKLSESGSAAARSLSSSGRVRPVSGGSPLAATISNRIRPFGPAAMVPPPARPSRMLSSNR